MIQRIKYSGLTMMFLLSLSISFAQKMKELTHREISEHYTDSSIKASILLENKKVRLKNTIDYYWYYNNTIKFNQGDFKGKLLDGDYQVLTKNGNLIRKGQFKTGYKVGVWKDWNTKGELLLVQKWSKGDKNGSYQKYFDGKLIEEGTYKNDLLHGKQVIYQHDTIFSVTNFKKGKEVIKSKTKKTEEETLNENDSSSKKWWKFWENKKQKINDEKTKNATDKNTTTEDKKNIKTQTAKNSNITSGVKTKKKSDETKNTVEKNTKKDVNTKLKTQNKKSTPEEKQKDKQKKKKDD